MRLLLSMILATATFLFAGDRERIGTYSPLLLTQGITSDAYQSIGFSNSVSTTIIDISTSNPASLNEFVSPSFGFNVEYSTKINNAIFTDIGYERVNPWLPTTAGFIYPINNFQIGISYHQKYSGSIDFGEIPITTIEDMDGSSGQTFSPVFETTIYSYSLLAAYSFKGIFQNEDKLSFGAQIFYDYLNSKEEIHRITSVEKGGDYSWKIGTVYKLDNLLSIGFLFENGVDIEGKRNIHDKGVVSSSILSIPEYTFNVRLPNKFIFGLTTNPINNLSFSATLTSVFWNSIGSNNKDIIEFSAGGIYKFPELFDISLGFYNTDGRYNETYFDNNLNATFISIELRISMKNLEIIFGINDSHLFSAEKRKQTSIRLGLGYSIK